jgi:hypothetical protein
MEMTIGNFKPVNTALCAHLLKQIEVKKTDDVETIKEALKTAPFNSSELRQKNVNGLITDIGIVQQAYQLELLKKKEGRPGYKLTSPGNTDIIGQKNFDFLISYKDE